MAGKSAGQLGIDTVRCTSSGWVKSRAAAVVLLLLLSVGAASNSGASLTVLLLDAKTAKPISLTTILLITWDEKGAARKLGQVTTQKDGSAVLSFTDPLPERIGLSYSPDEVANCSDIAFSTKEILGAGIVARNDCDVAKARLALQPKPGQLVVFASKIASAGQILNKRRTQQPTNEKAQAYFPAEVTDGLATYFSAFLSRIGEPSLVDTAQDQTAVCYRLSSMSFVPSLMTAIRLCSNPDGTANIATTREFPPTHEVRKIESKLSAGDVVKLERRLEKADFWSMPTTEGSVREVRPNHYEMDAPVWVLEGVRGGQYHVVFRRAPDHGAFWESVHFLAEDLAPPLMPPQDPLLIQIEIPKTTFAIGTAVPIRIEIRNVSQAELWIAFSRQQQLGMPANLQVLVRDHSRRKVPPDGYTIYESPFGTRNDSWVLLPAGYFFGCDMALTQYYSAFVKRPGKYEITAQYAGFARPEPSSKSKSSSGISSVPPQNSAVFTGEIESNTISVEIVAP
jgi:hypothetical protein